jgi:hypothetical protein
MRNLSRQCVGPFCLEVAWTGDIAVNRERDIEVKTIPELSDLVSGSSTWHTHPQGASTRMAYESRLKQAFFIPPVIAGIIIGKPVKDDTLIPSEEQKVRQRTCWIQTNNSKQVI